MKNNRVKLYVIWPFLPSDYSGMPRLFEAEFKEGSSTYQCKKEDYPNETTFRAFGWSQSIHKQIVKGKDKLEYGGFPALFPEQAVTRWRRHLEKNLEGSKSQTARIQAALRGFKTPKELKHER